MVIASASRDPEYLLDAFEAEVLRRRPELTAPPDAEGFRRATAAALLFRGLELLDAARACRGQVLAPAAELVLRAAIEVALRGRFLLGPNGDDEFTRMTWAFLDRGAKQATTLGTDFGGLSPEFVAAVIPTLTNSPQERLPEPGRCKSASGPAPPRNLYDIALALDKNDGLDEQDRRSSRRVYRVFYAALSESATHSGLAALRRFTELREGRAAVDVQPEPLTSGRKLHLIVGGLLGDLAHEVFVAFGVSTSELDDLGVQLTGPGS